MDYLVPEMKPANPLNLHPQLNACWVECRAQPFDAFSNRLWDCNNPVRDGKTCEHAFLDSGVNFCRLSPDFESRSQVSLKKGKAGWKPVTVGDHTFTLDEIRRVSEMSFDQSLSPQQREQARGMMVVIKTAQEQAEK